MFKNQYQPNRQMIREYASKVVCRGFFIRSVILVLIALAVFVIAFLKSSLIIAVVEAVAGIAVFISILFMPEAVTRRLLSEETDVHGVALCTITFGDVMTVTKPSSQSSIEYDLITKIYELNSCYVIKASDSSFLVKKGCFVEGDEKLFRSFLMNHCPQVKNIVKR